MAKVVRRSAQPSINRLVRQHLVTRRQGALVTEQERKLKGQIMAWLDDNVEPDMYGHRTLVLDEPIEDGAREYTQFRRERRASSVFNADTAEEILSDKGLLDQAMRHTLTVTLPLGMAQQEAEGSGLNVWAQGEWTSYIDQDEIYVLNQKGKLTDAEVDRIITEKETFAYVPK